MCVIKRKQTNCTHQDFSFAPPVFVPPPVRRCYHPIMKRNAREFLQSTTTLLDHVLASLTQEQQHELLDALAGEVEERLDALVDAVES